MALLTPAALATSSSGTARPRPRNASIAARRICSALRLASARNRGSADVPSARRRPTYAATEAILADSGVAWTALRYGFFGSLDQLLGPWQQTGIIAKPADGPTPWTDRADLAEAAAVILAGDQSFDGPVTLTAPAVTLDDFATNLSELTGRTIERIVVEDEQWVAEQIANGAPEFVARLTLTMFQATRSGYFAARSPLLAELLGREPRSATEQVKEHIAA